MDMLTRSVLVVVVLKLGFNLLRTLRYSSDSSKSQIKD
jgi:hypothetical protein